ncbi:MAG: Spo0B domain-containing protein [Dethiobacter sp.]|nr:Spo0B domain-containing protein [Dethiobacter sp.]MBS3901192.1 Spo0B domain-containing protein [Dethiobacter sp.]MBS3989116.1 Spo0B domain-containing protein [Dethiobacter sp.]
MYELRDAMAELVDIYRHDFLNVLQVVGGLAQLNRTDRLMAYIRSASEEAQQFGKLINCGDPRLALLLYKELLHALGGNYLLDVRETMPLLSVETLEGLGKPLQILRQQLQEIEQAQVTVGINGKEYPKLIISVSLEKGQDSFWEAVIAASSENGMIASVRDGGDILFNLDSGSAAGEQ